MKKIREVIKVIQREPTKLGYNLIFQKFNFLQSGKSLSGNHDYYHLYIIEPSTPKEGEWGCFENFITIKSVLKIDKNNEPNHAFISKGKIIASTDSKLWNDGVYPLKDGFIQNFTNKEMKNIIVEYNETTNQPEINENGLLKLFFVEDAIKDDLIDKILEERLFNKEEMVKFACNVYNEYSKQHETVQEIALRLIKDL